MIRSTRVPAYSSIVTMLVGVALVALSAARVPRRTHRGGFFR